MPKITAAITSAITLTLLVFAIPLGAQEVKPKVVRSKLARALEIDGVPCAAGYVFREESTGRLDQCRLDRDAVVRNADLPKGTTVALDPDGSLHHVFLPGSTMVGEHSCRGGGHDWMALFHPNGALRLCWLSRDEVIQGVPCARATFWGEFFGGKYATTELHDNGSLASCVTSAAADIGGRHYAAGERVKLGPDGKLSESR